MAITKNTPTKKAAEPRAAEKTRTAEKPAISKPGTADNATVRTSANRQIRIEDSAAEPFTAFKSDTHKTTPISPELRQHMIRDAAYFRAERRGFTEGDPVQDWIEAEAEIDRMLLEEKGSTARK